MPKIKVTYMKEITEEIYWPEDEMPDFNYDNLEANLGCGLITSDEIELSSISSVEVDGKEYQF